MSKADKMFEELGYEKQEIDERIKKIFLIYHKITEQKTKKRFCFSKRKTIQCDDNFLYLSKIDMQELQAIFEKCKELGWLDE